MNSTEFRERGQEMVDYIVDYLESISQRRVSPNVFPNYLQSLLPSAAPKTGETFERIMEDFEKYIMPGLTHWQHPRFHAFFPGNTSFPSILAEMLSDAIGFEGFNWDISPAGIELETIVCDWYGKMIGLPKKFLHYGDDSKGGGTIQNTASECIFISMFAARQTILKQLRQKNETLCQEALLASLIAYCSAESHSCAEKAAMILMVTMKVLDTDENFRLRGETLTEAIQADKDHGLIPFFVSTIVGSTSCGSCDPIHEMGPICESQGLWLHVDAAYAGSSMICPEYRPLLKGMEYASSFNVNPTKGMPMCMDCSVLWTTDRRKIDKLSIIDKTLLHHDFKKHGNRTSRKRFRALKLWFVIRSYGVEGLQNFIRNHARLAKVFENYVKDDDRFELLTSQFGLVCFRLKGSNILNKKLLMGINASAKLLLTACKLRGRYVIRFCVCNEHASDDDIAYAWSVFRDFASELLEAEHRKKSNE